MRLLTAILIITILSCKNDENSTNFNSGLLEYIDPTMGISSNFKDALSASTPWGSIACGPRHIQIFPDEFLCIGHIKPAQYGTSGPDLLIAPLITSQIPTNNRTDLARALTSLDLETTVKSDAGWTQMSYSNGVTVQISATDYGAAQRYDFPEKSQPVLLLTTLDSSMSVMFDLNGDHASYLIKSASGQQHFAIEFSDEPQSFEAVTLDNGDGFLLYFEPGSPLELKVGYSGVNSEGADAALTDLEGGFERVRDKAIQRWQALINRIELDAPDLEVLNEFYTALYFSFHHPVLLSDALDQYMDDKGAVHQTSRKLYHHFPTKAESGFFSLVTLISPEFIDDFTHSMMIANVEEHEWKNLISPSEIVMGTEAYLKGFRDFDEGELYYKVKELLDSDLDAIDLDIQAYLFWCASQLSLLQSDIEQYEVFIKQVKNLEEHLLTNDSTLFLPFDMRAIVNSVASPGYFDTLLEKTLEQPGLSLFNHWPYLYNYSGSAWKTQQAIADILSKKDYLHLLHQNHVAVWTVFTNWGFYPVNPPEGVYVIGVPSFTRAELHFKDGDSFILRGRFRTPENYFVQVGTLQEEPLSRSYIRQFEIVEGGEMILEMGPVPNYLHWSDLEATPPSLSDPDIE